MNPNIGELRKLLQQCGPHVQVSACCYAPVQFFQEDVTHINYGLTACTDCGDVCEYHQLVLGPGDCILLAPKTPSIVQFQNPFKQEKFRWEQIGSRNNLPVDPFPEYNNPGFIVICLLKSQHEPTPISAKLEYFDFLDVYGWRALEDNQSSFPLNRFTHYIPISRFLKDADE